MPEPRPRRATARMIERAYRRMAEAAGPRHWWPAHRNGPAQGRDEIIIGAVLTQNTSWKNVERALDALDHAGLLDLRRLARLESDAIAPHIRASGYFNLKARRLRAVATFFAPGGRHRYARLARLDDETLRKEILNIHGVGPETADSIMLYALGRATFVIDAYTLRIGRRHGWFDASTDYETARAWFNSHLPTDTTLFNEFHALLVWIGNRFCKPRPLCEQCPLARRDCFSDDASWQTMMKPADSS